MKRTILIFILVQIGLPCVAQTEATQYFMNSLPQVSINNPAFIPRYNFSIGLPVLSSMAFQYSNNGFSYNDLITKSNGEVVADLNKWNKALTQKNYITTSAQVDLLRIGVRVNRKVYLQLSSTAKE